jgi:hypothetical protein
MLLSISSDKISVEELLYYVIGFSLTIIGMIASVAYWLGRKFALIDKKFESLRNEFREELREVRTELDSKLGGLKAELGSVEAELKAEIDGTKAGLKAELDGVKAGLKAEIDSVERELKAELGSVETKLRAEIGDAKVDLKAELDGVRAGLKAEIDSVKAELGGRLDALQEEVRELRGQFARAFEGLRTAVSSSHALILDFLALKGLLDEREARFVKAEIDRMISMVQLNPITREELEFLKRVVAKDVNEITLEEAERVAEIGKRWWFEEGSEIAYKVYLAGLVIRGYLISKAVREGRKPWLEPPFKRSDGVSSALA